MVRGYESECVMMCGCGCEGVCEWEGVWVCGFEGERVLVGVGRTPPRELLSTLNSFLEPDICSHAFFQGIRSVEAGLFVICFGP